MTDAAQPRSVTPGPKTCARCGAAFTCKVDDLAHCQCIGVRLSADLLGQLAASYDDCLCSRCLKELTGAEHRGASGGPA